LNIDAIYEHKERSMSDLKKDCLGVTAMQFGDVDAWYGEASRGSTIRRLCLSHERLRAERDGAESLWKAEIILSHGAAEKLKSAEARTEALKTAFVSDLYNSGEKRMTMPQCVSYVNDIATIKD
jgi:hypothetical protein